MDMSVLLVGMQSGKPSDIVRVESRVFEKARHFPFQHFVGLLIVVAVPLPELGLKGQKAVPNHAFRRAQFLAQLYLSPARHQSVFIKYAAALFVVT